MNEMIEGKGTKRTDYRVAQKVIHWLMAAVIIMDLVVAQKMGRPMEEWDRLESRSDHSTLGVIIGLLLLVRLYYRLRYGAVALPAGMPNWQENLARVSHFLLYVLMICLVAAGLLTAANATAPVMIFGQALTLGNLDEAQFQFVRQFHEAVTMGVIGLILIHILAALYHQFILKDGSLVKMLKFWRGEKRPGLTQDR